MTEHTTPQRFAPSGAIRSLPALAAQLRIADQSPEKDRFVQLDKLVQVYTIHNYDQPQEEANAATHVVHHILDRMRRLASAYTEWQQFDSSAYFDLSRNNCAQIIDIEERVSTVNCTFYVDPLLPSFRTLSTDFSQLFLPSYQRRHHNSELSEHFFEEIQPAFVDRWLWLQHVLVQIRSQLAMDINFLAMNDAESERWHQREMWEKAAAPGLDERLTPPLRLIPTLTLSHEFPLPAYRQAGRKRRLWLNRERRRIFRRK